VRCPLFVECLHQQTSASIVDCAPQRCHHGSRTFLLRQDSETSTSRPSLLCFQLCVMCECAIALTRTGALALSEYRKERRPTLCDSPTRRRASSAPQTQSLRLQLVSQLISLLKVFVRHTSRHSDLVVGLSPAVVQFRMSRVLLNECRICLDGVVPEACRGCDSPVASCTGPCNDRGSAVTIAS
jgi:hypothetical protein